MMDENDRSRRGRNYDDSRSTRHIRRKALKLRPLPLKLQLDAGGGIFYIAPQLIVQHQLVDKRAKAHALHYAVDLNERSFHHKLPAVR